LVRYGFRAAWRRFLECGEALALRRRLAGRKMVGNAFGKQGIACLVAEGISDH
jgi:hypothetical protein